MRALTNDRTRLEQANIGIVLVPRPERPPISLCVLRQNAAADCAQFIKSVHGENTIQRAVDLFAHDRGSILRLSADAARACFFLPTSVR